MSIIISNNANIIYDAIILAYKKFYLWSPYAVPDYNSLQLDVWLLIDQMPDCKENKLEKKDFEKTFSLEISTKKFFVEKEGELINAPIKSCF